MARVNTNTTTPKTIKATIRISRFSGSGDGFHIEVGDDASRLLVLHGRAALDQAAALFTGGDAEFDVTLYESPHYGKEQEVRHVMVKRRGDKNFARVFDRAEANNPGWVADREDRPNPHRDTAVGYAVTLRRWV